MQQQNLLQYQAGSVKCQARHVAGNSPYWRYFMEFFVLIVLLVVTVLILVQLGIALHANAQQSTRLEMLTRSLESLTEQADARARKSEETVAKLVDANNQRLEQIGEKVEQRLDRGFEKTSKVFEDVLKRLVEIDKAQEKIAELSGNVVSLQEVLSDKRSRGAFGEVQLTGLISNMMPENSYSLQHTFNNGVRADCVLFLPEPTGTLCIDSKFPLESYQRMTDLSAGDADRATAERQFRQDIKKHIKDISAKYIIPGETSEGAVMFIPAEAVFSEIHSRYPDLVEEAQRARVWLTSPTTMMAVLTTARAVLKDAATRKQVHIIQKHLTILAQDFGRFQTRMDKLANHIGMAHKDVGDVQTSARKITSRFEKIEKADLAQPADKLE
ncbi:DNA recombination protein RmuC [Tichowtungia aerotolerans]|uniref:DNA recombination protein RmuC n=2 Tax=Tichowtungia aerotolerans TaxID=2697043 RepID=A0A6P1M764_9BACT|nr:DNA recombination protein RmuC [Tichowtungia aerotolerans]